MTNIGIFKRVIEKAINNGFYFTWTATFYDSGVPYFTMIGDNHEVTESVYEIIFSHEFAKAFWGDDIIEIEDDSQLGFPEGNPYKIYTCWRYHLQQMVLEKEPLKYLERFL